MGNLRFCLPIAYLIYIKKNWGNSKDNMNGSQKKKVSSAGLCLCAGTYSIKWHTQGECRRPRELVCSLSGKYPVANHGIWSFPPCLHVSLASRMHYMEDYPQEKFVFTQMLIALDKLICWMSERKLQRSVLCQFFVFFQPTSFGSFQCPP